LLNSKTERLPDGVGNSHGLVGTRILEHIGDSFVAQLPASQRSKRPSFAHNPFQLNAEPHGFYFPPFAKREGCERLPFAYGVQGTISEDSGLVYIAAFGATVPSDTNRLRLDKTQKNRFGAPIALIDFSWAPPDLAMWKDSSRALAEMIEAFETETLVRFDHPFTQRVYDVAVNRGAPIPGSNHESGGARMGFDPASSVLDPFNRVWDSPNVLVCDSACFPCIPHQNPTLTTMALAVRAARQLVADA
jgi:choline dehydrogenase-like flavoprotein